MKRIITGLLMLVLVTLPLVGCAALAPDTSTPEPTEEPELADEPEASTSMEQIDSESLSVPEILPYMMGIDTYQYAYIGIELAKGEVLNVRMYIEPWEDRGDPGENFMFQILDQGHRIVFDAGRVEGVYEFSYIPERSGRYLMTFLDDRGHCFIKLYHDYEGEFWEYVE